MDPDLPLAHIRTLKNLVRDATRDVRLICNIMNVCMGVAIALVAIGLYGTLSYHVSRRAREVGVRLAIGASRGDVIRLVLQQGFSWVLAGLLLGTGGALLAARILRALLYDINPLDPMALTAAALAVTIAAALACWLPAFRAAMTDPMEALRCE
jgi:ABC-type antimicrobial peptide transport system permease subunit